MLLHKTEEQFSTYRMQIQCPISASSAYSKLSLEFRLNNYYLFTRSCTSVFQVTERKAFEKSRNSAVNVWAERESWEAFLYQKTLSKCRRDLDTLCMTKVNCTHGLNNLLLPRIRRIAFTMIPYSRNVISKYIVHSSKGNTD